MLIDIAGRTDHRTLVGAHRVHFETAVLWGAAARVPQQDMTRGTLDESDSSDLTAVIRELAERDLWITETISHSALRSGVRQHGVEVLLVDDISRLAHPVARALMARGHGGRNGHCGSCHLGPPGH